MIPHETAIHHDSNLYSRFLSFVEAYIGIVEEKMHGDSDTSSVYMIDAAPFWIRPHSIRLLSIRNNRLSVLDPNKILTNRLQHIDGVPILHTIRVMTDD